MAGHILQSADCFLLQWRQLWKRSSENTAAANARNAPADTRFSKLSSYAETIPGTRKSSNTSARAPREFDSDVRRPGNTSNPLKLILTAVNPHPLKKTYWLEKHTQCFYMIHDFKRD